jgi:hypothetical protein
MMRRFFQLRDEVFAGRWHLGEVTSSDGTEPRLRAGIPLRDAGTLAAPVTHPGRVLDYSLTSFAVPIASKAVARAVSAIAGADVQCIPVAIAGQSGMHVLNAVRVISCLDQARSEFLKWTEQDIRADLAGQYKQVTKLIIDPSAIPSDAHFFRIEGWLVALIVSEEVKEAMERAGCLGAKFIAVSPQ